MPCPPARVVSRCGTRPESAGAESIGLPHQPIGTVPAAHGPSPWGVITLLCFHIDPGTACICQRREWPWPAGRRAARNAASSVAIDDPQRPLGEPRRPGRLERGRRGLHARLDHVPFRPVPFPPPATAPNNRAARAPSPACACSPPRGTPRTRFRSRARRCGSPPRRAPRVRGSRAASPPHPSESRAGAGTPARCRTSADSRGSLRAPPPRTTGATRPPRPPRGARQTRRHVHRTPTPSRSLLRPRPAEPRPRGPAASACPSPITFRDSGAASLGGSVVSRTASAGCVTAAPDSFAGVPAPGSTPAPTASEDSARGTGIANAVSRSPDPTPPPSSSRARSYARRASFV